MTNIGWYNIGFTYDYCLTEGFNIVAQDVGDVFPRKISFNPVTGKVVVKRLSNSNSKEIERNEERYCKNISKKDVDGGIELF
jgi:chemotaxis protein CheD